MQLSADLAPYEVLRWIKYCERAPCFHRRRPRLCICRLVQHGLLSVKEANDWLAQNKYAACAADEQSTHVLALPALYKQRPVVLCDYVICKSVSQT